MIKRYIVNKKWLMEDVKVYEEEEHEVCIYNDIKDNLIEWHSVEDEPPETGMYWVLDEYSKISNCPYYNNSFDKGWPLLNRPHIKWWAIPKPPKGNEKETKIEKLMQP